MARRTPDGPPPPPVVQRIRLRYAKRGRLRFVSHRDFARAFERALRRADIPIAYSAGFSPHPKVSYVGAAPTGVASEAEYLEIGLAETRDPEQVRAALDRALPAGLDVTAAVVAGSGSFADRMIASRWRLELPGVGVEAATAAVTALLATPDLNVERMTKAGVRRVDVRGAIVSAAVAPGVADELPADGSAPAAKTELSAAAASRAILDVVVRQAIPAVRPDDVMTALRIVAGLALDTAPVACRLAQGPLDESGRISDPLDPDRAPAATPGALPAPPAGPASREPDRRPSDFAASRGYPADTAG